MQMREKKMEVENPCFLLFLAVSEGEKSFIRHS